MRTRLPLLGGPVLLALALTGCSSSSATAHGTGTPTTGTAPSTSATPSPTPGSVVTSPSGGPTSTPSRTTTTTSAPTTRVSAAASPTSATRTSAPQGAAPGTYTYDTSGSYTYYGTTQDATSTTTLTVAALTNGTQHSTMKGDQSTTDEDLQPRTTGTYAAGLKIATAAFTVEFRPSPSVLLFPTPATAGKTWSWSATSTDGKTTATASNKILRTESLTIGGTKVSTVVLQTHLVLSGSVDYTADITNWVSPAHHLVVKEHTLGKGNAGGIAFTTDLTDVLRSVQPA